MSGERIEIREIGIQIEASNLAARQLLLIDRDVVKRAVKIGARALIMPESPITCKTARTRNRRVLSHETSVDPQLGSLQAYRGNDMVPVSIIVGGGGGNSVAGTTIPEIEGQSAIGLGLQRRAVGGRARTRLRVFKTKDPHLGR